MSSTSSRDQGTIRDEDLSLLKRSALELEGYVRREGFRGYDPYDALLSPLLRALPGRYPRVAATQFMVYSPLNVRKALGIEKGKNPKALALFLSSYCDLRSGGLISQDLFESSASLIMDDLMKAASRGYHGCCWGFDFPWQDVTRYSEPGLPTIVVSSFVGNALLDAYSITKEPACIQAAQGVCEFIMEDLNVLEDEDGICYSYTPIDHHAVHNANALGAALLSRVYRLTGRKKCLQGSVRAINHLLAHQEEDGSWAYSYDPKTGRKRMQLDFHQGFILSSLADFIEFSGLHRPHDREALEKGAMFYRNAQFHPSGRAYWRLPWQRPTDIHHQSQGILTFSRLGRSDPEHLRFALTIARWTIENMRDPSGHFYYQRYGPVSNRIPYMRWGQAWMMLALGRLCLGLEQLKGEAQNKV